MTPTTNGPDYTERLVPHDDEAEIGVLGCIELDPECLPEVLGILTAGDFHDPARRTYYAAIERLYRSGAPIDLITIAGELRRADALDAVGGEYVVGSFSRYVSTAANVVAYAESVAYTAFCRRFIHAGTQVARLAYDRTLSGEEMLAEAYSLLRRAAERRTGVVNISARTAIQQFLSQQLDAIEQGALTGVRTEFDLLDDALVGMKPGELFYLCGRPGSGKSAFATTLGERVASRLARDGVDGTVEYLTLEMRATQVVGRILAAHAGVNTRVLRANFRNDDGSVDRAAYEAIRDTGLALMDALDERLQFRDQPIRMSNVRAYLEQAVSERGCRLAILDYIGLVQPDDDAARLNEYQRISNLSRALKSWALELNIPILCLVQMSRASEGRGNPRPMLSDLRDSGQLEQDADGVLGMYRGATYLKKLAEVDPRFSEFAELLILKARESEPNVTVPLRFEGAFARFSDWPLEWSYDDYLRYTRADEPGQGGNGGGLD